MANYLKRQILKLKTFVADKILGVHDSPHRIALGVAIGIFVTWTPTIGFQMALTLALSTLFRANKVVGVPLVWISNPATLWIYIPNYLLGCRLLGEAPSTDVLIQSLAKAFGLNDHGLKERFLTLVQTLWDVLAPLMLGSVIVGAFLGAAAYAATYKGVQIFQNRRALAGTAAGEPNSPVSALEDGVAASSEKASISTEALPGASSAQERISQTNSQESAAPAMAETDKIPTGGTQLKLSVPGGNSSASV